MSEVTVNYPLGFVSNLTRTVESGLLVLSTHGSMSSALASHVDSLDLRPASATFAAVGSSCEVTLLGSQQKLAGTFAAHHADIIQILLPERISFDEPVQFVIQDICLLGEVHWLWKSGERFLVTIRVEHKVSARANTVHLPA